MSLTQVRMIVHYCQLVSPPWNNPNILRLHPQIEALDLQQRVAQLHGRLAVLAAWTDVTVVGWQLTVRWWSRKLHWRLLWFIMVVCNGSGHVWSIMFNYAWKSWLISWSWWLVGNSAKPTRTNKTWLRKSWFAVTAHEAWLSNINNYC